MIDYQLHGEPGSDTPHAMSGAGRRAGADPIPTEIVLSAFAAPSWDAALALFRSAQAAGIEATFLNRHGRQAVGRFWIFTGSPGHLDHQAARLGISQATLRKAEQMAELHGISTLIGQLYGRYQAVRGPSKPPRKFTHQELLPVQSILDECERPLARLHAAAAAAHVMVDEARAAFDLPLVPRTYGVVADSDMDTGITTIAREELHRLREVEMRASELRQHADLADTKLAAAHARIDELEQALASRDMEIANQASLSEAHARTLQARIDELEADITSRPAPAPVAQPPANQQHQQHQQPRKPVPQPPHKRN